jgi:hypothetical protein
MSDQAAAEPSSGEQGSLTTGVSHAAEVLSEPAASEAAVYGPFRPEPAIAEAVTPEAPKVEAAKVEAVKAEVAAAIFQPEAASEKISNVPGKVIVMPRGERAWAGPEIDIEPEAATQPQESVFGKRRIAAIAAMLALATTAGAIGGGLATASLMHGSSDVALSGGQNVGGSQNTSLEASLSRIDGDIQALKSGLDHTSKLGMSQFNKTTDRLDKLERAQAEPAAKLAKLSEAIDKLHALPVPPPVVAAASAVSSASKETTGSISSTTSQQAAAVPPSQQATTPKSEVGRLPTVDGWVLRDVAYGGALIDSRRGTYEVYAGDVIPGLGRVDAIRRQDGRWVVVTSRGLIVAR